MKAGYNKKMKMKIDWKYKRIQVQSKGSSQSHITIVKTETMMLDEQLEISQNAEEKAVQATRETIYAAFCWVCVQREKLLRKIMHRQLYLH